MNNSYDKFATFALRITFSTFIILVLFAILKPAVFLIVLLCLANWGLFDILEGHITVGEKFKNE